MTFDETRNSWFPHISPDGKSVVFITYYKGDLEPGEHLANKNVELRLMPANGGEPKTLLKLSVDKAPSMSTHGHRTANA